MYRKVDKGALAVAFAPTSFNGGLVYALMVMSAGLLAAAPDMRRESELDFVTDEAFQAGGGVQYFFELAPPTLSAAPGSALERFRALDPEAPPIEPTHLVMGRIEYVIDRDASFFTEARARDVEWLQRVAPQSGVRAQADGSFKVSATPANRFVLTWYSAPRGDEPALAAFMRCLSGRAPTSVIVQKNHDFARFLGWRTAERSLTYTAHVSLGPGRTRVIVYTSSLLYNVPPAFLGGAERVLRESVEGAQSLIVNMRAQAGRD